MKYTKLDIDIVRPDSEKSREFEYIILENKLEVLIISDPKTEKGAASMDVKVGHFMDPNNIPGLAHFCEHMLFLGTKKYPQEGGYQEFIKKNAGYQNAYTDMMETNYYFDVSNDALEEALDRFAQFFISPTFTEDCLMREIKAVDSENSKNLQSDSWRFFQLLKSLSHPKHPFSKFGSGNFKTLNEEPKKQGLNLRDELVKFYHCYYSANIMRLCVLGKDPLSTLRNWVIEKFSPIENKEVTVPTFDHIPIFEKDRMQKIYHITPIRDLKSLELYFPVHLDFKEMYLKKPLYYLSHLIGHEAKGSLFNYMKEKGWISGLMSGVSYSFLEYCFFSIKLSLTDEGENHCNEIIDLVFQYIKLLREKGIRRWIFDECKDIALASFKFMDQMNPDSIVRFASSKMNNDYAKEHILSGSLLIFDFDEKSILKMLELITPQNMLIFHCGGNAFQHNQTDHGILNTGDCCSENGEEAHGKSAGYEILEEQWYGTKYRTETIEDERIKKWMNPSFIDENLVLPMKNVFITTNFELKKMDNETEYPIRLIDTKFSEIWFKQDSVKFKIPKAVLIFELLIPTTYASPQFYVFCRIFSDLLVDTLNQYSYDADIAGLSYSVTSNSTGLGITLEGYNQNIKILLNMIIDTLKKMEPRKERFLIMKEKYHRILKNSLKEQPYSYGISRTLQFFMQNRYHLKEYLTVLDANQINFELFEIFLKLWLRSVKIVGLMHGNLTKEEAEEIAEEVEKKICNGMVPLLPSEEQSTRISRIGDGYDYIFQELSANVDDQNSSIEIIYQIGLGDNRNSMFLEILNQIMSAAYYEQIRTKEQIGYITHTRKRSDANVVSFSAIVQSSERSPEYILERNDAFIHSFHETLKALPNEEFISNVKSLKQVILEEKKQLASQSSMYWSEITFKQYGFSRREDCAKILDEITKDELVDFFERYLLLNSKFCKRLIVQIFAHKFEGEMFKGTNCEGWEASTPSTVAREGNSARQTIYIHDLNKFKNSLHMYPSHFEYKSKL